MPASNLSIADTQAVPTYALGQLRLLLPALFSAKIMQVSAMKVYFLFAKRSLFSAKIMQVSAMKVYFLFAKRSLFSAKIMQVSAMKVYFLFAERSLFSANVAKFKEIWHIWM
ncbi:hypothetical protein [Prevotella fusca]|nr:hypothetical protein [Prevotella fusca]